MEDTLQQAKVKDMTEKQKKCLDCMQYHRPLCYKGFKVDSGHDGEGIECKEYTAEIKQS